MSPLHENFMFARGELNVQCSMCITFKLIGNQIDELTLSLKDTRNLFSSTDNLWIYCTTGSSCFLASKLPLASTSLATGVITSFQELAGASAWIRCLRKSKAHLFEQDYKTYMVGYLLYRLSSPFSSIIALLVLLLVYHHQASPRNFNPSNSLVIHSWSGEKVLKEAHSFSQQVVKSGLGYRAAWEL